jgi:hypothetical protein
MSDEVDETNAGVSKKGSWSEVSEFGEEVERTMEGSAEETSLKEFSRWRPREDEAENDLLDKTIEEATLAERKMEQRSDGLEELRKASESVKRAGRKAVEREVPDEEFTRASRSFLRPIVSGVATVVRKIEELAYSKFVLRSDRWYFDSEDFSADMKSTRDGQYRLDINVSGKEKRRYLQESFRDE